MEIHDRLEERATIDFLIRANDLLTLPEGLPGNRARIGKGVKMSGESPRVNARNFWRDLAKTWIFVSKLFLVYAGIAAAILKGLGIVHESWFSLLCGCIQGEAYITIIFVVIAAAALLLRARDRFVRRIRP